MGNIQSARDKIIDLMKKLSEIESDITFSEKEKSIYEQFQDDCKFYIRSIEQIQSEIARKIDEFNQIVKQENDEFLKNLRDEKKKIKDKCERELGNIDKNDTSEKSSFSKADVIDLLCEEFGKSWTVLLEAYERNKDVFKDASSKSKAEFDTVKSKIETLIKKLSDHLEKSPSRSEFQALLEKKNEKEKERKRLEIILDRQKRDLCLNVTKKLYTRIIRNCIGRIVMGSIFVFVDIWLILCSLDFSRIDPSAGEYKWNIFNYCNIMLLIKTKSSGMTVFFIVLIITLLILLVIFVNNIINRYLVTITQTIANRNEVESYIITADDNIKTEIVNNKIRKLTMDIHNRLNRNMTSTLFGLED